MKLEGTRKKIPTSFAVDVDLLDRLRKRAIVEELSVSAVISKAVKEYLDNNPVEV